MSSPCTRLYNLGSLTSKRKRFSLHKLLKQLPSPCLGLVVVVAISLILMSTSRQKNVIFPCPMSCAYASWPTKWTETRRADVVVQLKEQQNNLLFPSWPVRTHENLKTLSITSSHRRANSVTVLSSVQEDIILHAIKLGFQHSGNCQNIRLICGMLFKEI